MSNHSPAASSRRCAFDVMNVLACIAVVAIHHNGMVHTFQDTVAWRQSLVAECGFYWCVPIFLMLSGATLLDYQDKYSTPEFFKRRIRRTVIPWLVWSVLILIEKLHTGEIVIEPFSLREAASLVLTYKVESTYWYFGALFPLYLCMPVFSALRNNRKALWYIVGASFVLNSTYPIIQRWLGLSFSLSFPIGGLSIYILLGYLLKDMEFTKGQRRAIYVLGVLAFAFRYVYTLVLSVQAGATDTSIKGYGNFHAILLSVAVFVFLNSIDWDSILSDKAKSVLAGLSACSFGIYLMHRAVMRAEIAMLGIEGTRFTWTKRAA